MTHISDRNDDPRMVPAEETESGMFKVTYKMLQIVRTGIVNRIGILKIESSPDHVLYLNIQFGRDTELRTS